jgi:hypothetical protein
VSGSPEGTSIGVLNFVRGGRLDVEASVDSSAFGTALVRHGGRRWHNVYGVGGHPMDRGAGTRSRDIWMYGLGLGPTWQVGATRVDVEAMAWQVNHGASHSDRLSLLAQLRASIAHPISRGVALVVGGAVNGYISSDRMAPLLVERRVPDTDTGERYHFALWLSAFVGVRL